MIRAILVFAALALVSVAISAAEPAPAPRPKKPVLYSPTTVGTKWVYQARDDEWTQVITDVKEKDGVYVVTLATLTEKGKFEDERKRAVSERGLVGVKNDKVLFNAANFELKLPYKEGETWTSNGITCRVLKIERVKVPAGEFDAIPIEITFEVEGRVIRAVHWYAPGVGLIKRGLTKDGPGVVLKSFTPGKEPPAAPKDKK